MPLKFLLSVVSIPGTRRNAHGRPWPWPLSGLDGKLVPVRRLRSVSHNFSVSLHYKPSYTELSCELQISEFSMSSVGWYFTTFCREWLETIPVNIEISQVCCVIRRLKPTEPPPPLLQHYAMTGSFKRSWSGSGLLSVSINVPMAAVRWGGCAMVIFTSNSWSLGYLRSIYCGALR